MGALKLGPKPIIIIPSGDESPVPSPGSRDSDEPIQKKGMGRWFDHIFK